MTDTAQDRAGLLYTTWSYGQTSHSCSPTEGLLRRDEALARLRAWAEQQIADANAALAALDAGDVEVTWEPSWEGMHKGHRPRVAD